MSEQNEHDALAERMRKAAIARARAADPVFDAKCAEEDEQIAAEQRARESREAALRTRPAPPAAQPFLELYRRLTTPKPVDGDAKDQH